MGKGRRCSVREKRLTRQQKEQRGGKPRLSKYARKCEREGVPVPLAVLPQPKQEPVVQVKSEPVVAKPEPPASLAGKGTVVRLRSEDHYGFLMQNDQRVYFTRGVVQGEVPREGQEVAFVAQPNEKGWKASSVTRL
jgi:cold shock CspA family protein